MVVSNPDELLKVKSTNLQAFHPRQTKRQARSRDGGHGMALKTLNAYWVDEGSNFWVRRSVVPRPG
jgi:hypothetical protein